MSLDPWGHVPQSIWADRIADRSLDIRPTIAVTKSHLDVPEIKTAVADGRMKAGGAGGLDSSVCWVGSAGCLTPLHYDCSDGLLAQAIEHNTGIATRRRRDRRLSLILNKWL